VPDRIPDRWLEQDLVLDSRAPGGPNNVVVRAARGTRANGFTRLDAPDPEDPTLVTRVELARDAPTGCRPGEVRGEGILRPPTIRAAGPDAAP
jgi:hypothetical protein